MRGSGTLLVVGVIAGILISIQFFSGFKRSDCPPCPTLSDSTRVVSTVRTTRIDTTYYIDTIRVAEEGVIGIPVRKTRTDKDTNDLVHYYTKEFTDSIENGEYKGSVKIQTFGNSLKDVKLNWVFTKYVTVTDTTIKTTINDSTTINTKLTYTVPELKNVLYAGASIGFRPNKLKDVSLNITLLMKSQRQIYYEISQPLETGRKLIHRVGAKFPIRISKRD